MLGLPMSSVGLMGGWTQIGGNDMRPAFLGGSFVATRRRRPGLGRAARSLANKMGIDGFGYWQFSR
jgi:hypothetical protein